MVCKLPPSRVKVRRKVVKQSVTIMHFHDTCRSDLETWRIFTPVCRKKPHIFRRKYGFWGRLMSAGVFRLCKRFRSKVRFSLSRWGFGVLLSLCTYSAVLGYNSLTTWFVGKKCGVLSSHTDVEVADSLQSGACQKKKIMFLWTSLHEGNNLI